MKFRIALSLLTIALNAVFSFAQNQTTQLNNLEFTILDDNTCCLSSGKDASGAVEIPEYVAFKDKQRKVTEIDHRAFYQNEEITELTFNNSLEIIKEWAIAGCSNLEKVKFGKNLKRIERDAFWDCQSLESIVLPEPLEYIGECAFQSFSYKSTTRYIEIPPTVRCIKERAFENPSLVKVYFKGELPECSEDIFRTAPVLLYVPNKYVEIYSSAFPKCDVVADDWDSSLTIHLDNPGTLINKINRNNVDYIREIILSGDINGTDILTINKFTKLVNLDLSKARIVEGGEPYYQTDKLKYNTQNDVLGRYWCYGLKYLQKLKLPESVTVIEDYACEDKNYLNELQLGEKIEKIGQYAFQRCFALELEELPESVSSIGKFAFDNCQNLRRFRLPPNLTTIPESLFSNCVFLEKVQIGENVNSIGQRAFYECTRLKEFHFPDCLQTLSPYMLSGCESLKEIYIPNGVTVISKNCFSGCSELSVLSIPESVTTFEEECFSNCTSLETVSIPQSVVTIFTKAFKGCTSLAEVCFKDGENDLKFCLSDSKDLTPLFNDSPLREVYFGRNFTYQNINIPSFAENKQTLYKVTIGPYVKRIEGTLFYECSNLHDINILSELEEIGRFAFHGCSSIEKFDMPETLTKIEEMSFRGCVSLKELTIPSSVNFIGCGAFTWCKALEKLIIEDSEEDLVYDNQYYEYSLIDDSPINYLYLGRSIISPITAPPFDNHPDLKNVEIGPYVTTLPYGCFDGCTSLKSVIMGENVDCIEDFAFRNCTSLSSFEIPSKVTKFKFNVLSGCTSLAYLHIPDSENNLSFNPQIPYGSQDPLILFGDSPLNGLYLGREVEIYNSDKQYSPFLYNPDIKTLTIGEKVTELKNGLFNKCINLEEIYSLNPVPPVIYNQTFANYNATLFVLEDCVNSYWLHPLWGKFLNLEEFDPSGVEDTLTDELGLKYNADFGILSFTGIPMNEIVEIWNFNGKSVYKGVPLNIKIYSGIYIVKTNGKTLKIFI